MSYALIDRGANKYKVGLSPLQVAQVAAQAAGFYNLDLKDNDAGHYTLVAYSKDRSLTCRGATQQAAVDKLLSEMGFQ